MNDISKAERELLNYINDTPRLMSLLYDIDLLPEQTMDNKHHWLKTMMVADAWKLNNEVEEKQ